MRRVGVKLVESNSRAAANMSMCCVQGSLNRPEVWWGVIRALICFPSVSEEAIAWSTQSFFDKSEDVISTSDRVVTPP